MTYYSDIMLPHKVSKVVSAFANGVFSAHCN